MMSSVHELVQKILICKYECEAGKLEHNLHFAELVQRCLSLEDALVRERLNKQPLLKRNDS